METCLRGTDLFRYFPKKNNIMGSGKMLRARLTLCLGTANGIDGETCTHAAAAVEIIHGASLLHDDVIDGGILRRGAPTFWKKHGINGAILLGDFLVFKAMGLLGGIDHSDLLRELIALATEVCQSEIEQELVLRGTAGTWEECEQIARSKTGSLFAFAAVAAASDAAPAQADALREAGFILGTAYQLADDILDVSGNEALFGKTLGKDLERGKTTAITAIRNAPENPGKHVYSLLEASSGQLGAWPRLQTAWDDFLTVTMKPVLSTHLSAESPMP